MSSLVIVQIPFHQLTLQDLLEIYWELAPSGSAGKERQQRSIVRRGKISITNKTWRRRLRVGVSSAGMDQYSCVTTKASTKQWGRRMEKSKTKALSSNVNSFGGNFPCSQTSGALPSTPTKETSPFSTKKVNLFFTSSGVKQLEVTRWGIICHRLVFQEDLCNFLVNTSSNKLRKSLKHCLGKVNKTIW